MPPPVNSSERAVVDWIVDLNHGYGACLDLHNACVDLLK